MSKTQMVYDYELRKWVLKDKKGVVMATFPEQPKYRELR